MVRVVLDAVVMAFGSLAVATSVAASSCPPTTLAREYQRAAFVVYGRVLSAFDTTLTVAVTDVYKGDAVPARLVVAVPAFPRELPQAYGPTSGDHTLYLGGRTGDVSSRACGHSHAGRPTPEELALFGPARGPTSETPGVRTAAAPTAAAPTSEADRTLVGAAAIAAIAGGLIVLGLLLRRTVRGRQG